MSFSGMAARTTGRIALKFCIAYGPGLGQLHLWPARAMQCTYIPNVIFLDSFPSNFVNYIFKEQEKYKLLRC